MRLKRGYASAWRRYATAGAGAARAGETRKRHSKCRSNARRAYSRCRPPVPREERRAYVRGARCVRGMSIAGAEKRRCCLPMATMAAAPMPPRHAGDGVQDICATHRRRAPAALSGPRCDTARVAAPVTASMDTLRTTGIRAAAARRDARHDAARCFTQRLFSGSNRATRQHESARGDARYLRTIKAPPLCFTLRRRRIAQPPCASRYTRCYYVCCSYVGTAARSRCTQAITPPEATPCRCCDARCAENARHSATPKQQRVAAREPERVARILRVLPLKNRSRAPLQGDMRNSGCRERRLACCRSERYGEVEQQGIDRIRRKGRE